MLKVIVALQSVAIVVLIAGGFALRSDLEGVQTSVRSASPSIEELTPIITRLSESIGESGLMPPRDVQAKLTALDDKMRALPLLIMSIAPMRR